MTVITRVPPGYYPIDNWLNVAGDITGVNDVTNKLNACLDYCRDNNLVALAPSGSIFKVSDTIRLLKNDGNSWSYPWQVLCLVGQHGVPPKIVLTNGSTGFETGHRKPVVHILEANTTTGQDYASVNGEAASTLYRAVLHYFDIDCGNNPGAVGLLFDSAQECNCSDVRITGTSYSAGIEGLPGRSMCSRNLEITGTFQYGIRTSNGLYSSGSTSLGAVISNLKIVGSTVAGISQSAARGALSIAGLYMAPTSGVGILCTGSKFGEYGNIVIKDGIIDMPAATAVCIDAQYTTINLKRVYVNRSTLICDHYQTARDFAGNSSGWFYVEGYKGGHALADANSVSSGGVVGESRYFRNTAGTITDTSLQSVNNGIVSSYNVPAYSFFYAQHYFFPPDITASNVIYATEVTTTAACYTDGITDNTTRIQAKIDEAATAGVPIFFPAGSYMVSSTFTLRSNSIVIGSHGSLTRFFATSAWRTAINTAATQAFYIDTDDDANGSAIIQNITCACIVYASTWLGFHRWRQGANSVRAELAGLTQASGRFDNPITQVLVTGNGGGRAWNIVAGSSLQNTQTAMDNFNTTSYRHQTYSGVRQKTILYGMNLEYGGAIDRTPVHAPVGLFTDSQNIYILSSKCEAWQACMEFSNASKVSIGQIALLSGSYQTIGNIGPVVKIDSTSSLECGSISNVWNNTSGSSPAPGVSSALIVSETPQVTPAVYRTAVFGGYESGTVYPVNNWDIVSTAPTFVVCGTSPADNAANAGTSFSITPPSGIQGGDLVLMCHSHRGTGTPAATPNLNILTTGGQTWTQIISDSTGNFSRMTIWGCTFNGTWSADPVVTADNTGGTVLIMAAFRGPTGTTGWYFSNRAKQAITSPATPFTYTYTGWTPQFTNAVNCFFAMCVSSSRTFTAPTAPWINMLPSSTQLRCSSTSSQSVIAHYQITNAATTDDSVTGSGGNNANALKISAIPIVDAVPFRNGRIITTWM